MKEYEFITARDEKHNLLQNGILYIKNRKSEIFSKFIIEIMSGVFNELLDINNKKSFIYNQKPSDDPFFYGPITLFKIYDEIKDIIKCKILETNLKNKVKTELTSNGYEFESFTKDQDTNIIYLQVKSSS
jgi:hypothetical protein